MKAIRCTGNSKLKIVEIPIPGIKPDQVLVRVKVSGICGSDIHRYRRSYPELNPETNEIVVTGHEPSGIVEKIGSCVNNVKVGDRVAVYHKFGCGKCKFCLEGKSYLCKEVKALAGPIDGSCAEYIYTDSVNCLKLPDDFTFEDGAVLMCGGGTGYNAVKKMQVSGADTVIIHGLGPVGLCSLIFAKAFGAKTIAVDPNDNRLKLAKHWGADYVINCSNDVMEENIYNLWENFWIPAMSSIKKVNEITKGQGATVAIIATPNIQARINGIFSVAKRGRISTIGMTGKGVSEDLQQAFNSIAFRELKVFGVNVFPITDYFEMIDLLRKNSISIGKTITHKFPIDEGKEAFKLADSQTVGKVAIVF